VFAPRLPRSALPLLLFLLAVLIAPLGPAALPAHADSAMRINELKINPPGDDGPWEYVELLGTPNATISNLYFVALEGDSPTGEIGRVDFQVNLSGVTTLSTGIVLIQATSQTTLTVPSGVRVLTSSALNGGALENGTTSFLLISSPTNIAPGSDLDANDDGVLELPSGASIQDAVAITDGAAGDITYGGVAFGFAGGNTPDALTRFPGNTNASSAAAWYYGELQGPGQDSLTYAAPFSPNFPVGGALTYAAPNVPDPSSTPSVVASCGGPLNVAQGTTATRNISAAAPNTTNVTATLTVTPTQAGITLGSTAFTPDSLGGSFTGVLTVSNLVPLGSYTATISFVGTPGGADSCTIPITVSQASPPPPGGLRIHDVQGAGHVSPLVGQLVSVPGIVTAIRLSGSTRGFYMQDVEPDNDPATSEGIFVFTGSSSTPDSLVTVGQSVVVTGTVSEFRPSSRPNDLSGTQIANPGLEIVVSPVSPAVFPTPTIIGQGGRVPPQTVIDDDTTGSVENPANTTFDPQNDGIDFYESLEGMLVTVNNPLVVGPTQTFGSGTGLNREIPVVADNGAGIPAAQRTARGGLIIGDDYSTFNPQRIILSDALRGGDTGPGDPALPEASVGDLITGSFSGVMDYSFSNFKLLNTGAAPLAINSSGRPPRETLGFTTGVTALLSVANFNVENLDPGDGAPQFNALANLIVANLKSPDIIALEEVQDNNGATNDTVVAADQTYTALINAIVTAGGPSYQFRQIDPVDDQDGGEPGGNIRVGFLFNPARVSFVDRPGGTATAATSVLAGPAGKPQLSFSPGRIDPNNPFFADSRKPLAGEFRFRGQTIFVIANHFNSKGGDQPLYGRFQPPTRSSEITRTQQAAIVNGFVDQILARDPAARVVVLGDINDFEFSPALRTLEGGVLTSLIKTLPKNERYTYNFEGNAQTLDHILVSNNLLNRVAAFEVVHVNSERADQVSDHDPQVAVLDFIQRIYLPIVGRNFAQ
jgi:hypothetical protein